MPTVDPYAGSPEAFTEAMWLQYAHNWRAGGESVFNKRSGESSLEGHIPASAIKAAMRFALGYEQVVPVSPQNPGAPKFTPVVTLCRKNPIRHPYYDNLYCTGVGELEFRPISEYVPGVGRQLKLPTAPLPPKTPPAIQNRTGYARAKFTLRFGPLDWDLYEDDNDTYPNLSANATEWVRNVSVDMEPRIETLETDWPYIFAEGTGLPAAYTNAKGTTATGKVAQIIVKPDVVIRWFDVPAAWIMKPGTLLPVNVLNAVGTLNSGFYANTFLGFPIGTLLLTGVKLTRHPWALRPALGLPGATTESKFLYDVELLCSYFNPPKGFTGTPDVQIATNLGHNNAPYRGSPTTVFRDKASGSWYYITTSGINDGTGVYKYSPWEDVFNSPQNTAASVSVTG